VLEICSSISPIVTHVSESLLVALSSWNRINKKHFEIISSSSNKLNSGSGSQSGKSNSSSSYREPSDDICLTKQPWILLGFELYCRAIFHEVSLSIDSPESLSLSSGQTTLFSFSLRFIELSLTNTKAVGYSKSWTSSSVSTTLCVKSIDFEYVQAATGAVTKLLGTVVEGKSDLLPSESLNSFNCDIYDTSEINIPNPNANANSNHGNESKSSTEQRVRVKDVLSILADIDPHCFMQVSIMLGLRLVVRLLLRLVLGLVLG
jgi:hypothetical protein